MAECRVIKSAVAHNYLMMKMLCEKNGAGLNVVSKFCLSNPKIIEFLANLSENPCRTISDSNMENFLKLDEKFASKITKCVIKTRLSDIKKIPSIPSYARPDRVFVSDEELLKEIEKLPLEMQPEVVLITETGDLKDGFMPDEILRICENMSKIKIIGVSVNFACLSGILPDVTTVKMLEDLACKVQQIRGLEKPFLSVGGTVVHTIAENGELRGLIQEIRSGEGIFFGNDSSGGQTLKGFNQKTIILRGEILEVSEKDFDLRSGHVAGFSATGHGKPEGRTCIEKGIRKRAVLDFGILGAAESDLVPVDSKIVPAGQTFDFTVVDVTDSSIKYTVGEGIDFVTNYGSASFAMMNRYIPCVLVEE